MRVLHAPVNVGNQPWVLSRHERALGIKSDLVLNYNTWINYNADRVLGTYANRTWSEVLKRLPFGLLAPFRYDVLHFYFGRSLLYWDDMGRFNRMPYFDIKLAKAMGKKVFMTLQGCDVRLAGDSNTRNRHTPCAPECCAAFETCVSTYDAQRRKLITDILPLCDRVFYLNPELGHFVPNGQFMPYASVDIEAAEVIPPTGKGRPIVVHAPSDPKVKGTERILVALEKLRDKYDFELVLVQGKTHAEAMEIYRKADLAIDQILYGWYGGFAVEIMAMGKPVACSIRQEDLDFIPKEMRAELPLLEVYPDTLESDFNKIFAMKDDWGEIGSRSRGYVLKWHNPLNIAKKLLSYYTG
jgi:hypothetical protein